MTETIAMSAILVVAILMIGATKAFAFGFGINSTAATTTQPQPSLTQEDNKTIIGGVEVLSLDQAQSGVDYYTKAMYHAELTNVSQTTLAVIIKQGGVYSCLADLVTMPNPDLSFCDRNLVDEIVNHELGNNQIIINLAHTYLKARGIQ